MHRLFVAILPPIDLREACLSMMGEGMPGWRWQDEDQLHITLRFIGDVDGRTGDDIAAALGMLRGPALDVGLSGVGWFDQGGGGTIFARVAPRDPLAVLHAKVDRAVIRAGLPPEGRAYFPHIALARGRRGAAPPHDWLARYAGLNVKPHRIDEFALIESTLGRAGATYETIERYPLARG